MRAHAQLLRGHVFHHQTPSHSAHDPSTHPSLLAALAALLAPTGAQAAKPVGPKLTITERLCNRGADPSERSIVLTVNAALPAGSTAVQLRFSVQRRATKKARWTTVPATPDSGLGTWSASTPGATLLSWTRRSTALMRAAVPHPHRRPGHQRRRRRDHPHPPRLRHLHPAADQREDHPQGRHVSNSGTSTDGSDDIAPATAAFPTIELRNSGRQRQAAAHHPHRSRERHRGVEDHHPRHPPAQAAHRPRSTPRLHRPDARHRAARRRPARRRYQPPRERRGRLPRHQLARMPSAARAPGTRQPAHTRRYTEQSAVDEVPAGAWLRTLQPRRRTP